MPNKFYTEIFNHSGASYHRAMVLFPNARDEEFKTALSLLSLQDSARIMDVPAGGGYLRNYLNNELYSSVAYSGFDFSTGFVKQSPINICTEKHIPAQDSYFDAAVCLAALHHVEDKPSFFNELHRTLKTGGQLLVGDVMNGSKEAAFLNSFVNDWNSLGHKGDFLCFDRDAAMLQKAGFSTKAMVKHYYWNFNSKADCHEYLRLLFSLDKNPSKALLNNAIAKLGKKESSTHFQLQWSLGFIVANTISI